MLLYDLAYRNDVNEQKNVAKDYPDVVKKIEDWLVETQPASKYLTIASCEFQQRC